MILLINKCEYNIRDMNVNIILEYECEYNIRDIIIFVLISTNNIINIIIHTIHNDINEN